jgi:RNA polymerase sigma-70 factor, ECF subfamily
VEATDSLLAARLVAGDDRALAEAFDTLGAAVYGSAMYVLGDAMTAQDVVQDVFLRLWTQPYEYDARRGSLRTYLMMCARHRALDHLRSELRRAGREERYERLISAQPEPSPGEQVTAAETACAVRDVLQKLSPKLREAVELAYLHRQTYCEVAKTLGISEGTAKSRIRLALARLETMLDRQLLGSE